jgi:hypothetical protein
MNARDDRSTPHKMKSFTHTNFLHHLLRELPESFFDFSEFHKA